MKKITKNFFKKHYLLLALLTLNINDSLCNQASSKTMPNIEAPKSIKVDGLVGNFSIKIGILMKGLINAKSCKPIQNKIVFNRIYLYGPRGCGKTTLAKTIAEQTGAKLFEKSAFSIVKPEFDKEVQEVGELFRNAHEHFNTTKQPVVVFIDEAHHLAQAPEGKSRLGAQALCLQLDKINNIPGIVVILASNNIDNVSKPLLDRFPYTIEIYNLDEQLRQDFFEVLWLKYSGKAPTDKTLMKKLAKESAGVSIRGLENTMKKAFSEESIEPNETKLFKQLNATKTDEFGTFTSKAKKGFSTAGPYLKGTLNVLAEISVIILAYIKIFIGG